MKRLTLVIVLAGCYADSDLVTTNAGTDTTSNALELSLACPACYLVADGMTPVEMRVCTEAEHRPSPLDVTLKTSAGTWVGSGGMATTTVSLAGSKCATASFIPTMAATDVLIQASVAGLNITKAVTLRPATLAFVSMTAAPSTLIKTTTSVVITAKANVYTGGTASIGTLMSADVNAIDPPSASYEFRPSTQYVDMTGSAAFTLVIPPNVNAVAYTVHATVQSSSCLNTDDQGCELTETTAAVQTIFAVPSS